MGTVELTGIGEGETQIVTRFLSLAFASTEEQLAQWLERAGAANLRVLRDGGRPVACLLRVEMGQFFGGRSLRLLGIAGVAVPPESRGKGYARRMMQMAMEEGAREGFALGGLYASTQTLYRQVGFEQGAHRYRIEVPLGTLGVVERGGAVEAMGDAQMGEIRACYSRFAEEREGLLDRGDYIWTRLRSNRQMEYRPFGVRNEQGELDGYFFLGQTRKQDTGRQTLELSDLVFNSGSSGRRLLGLLADFGSMADEFVFYGGPTHPALMMMPQQRYHCTSKDTHLTRVLDVRRAIEGRGYNPLVEGVVHLEVSDPLIAANRGRFVVEVGGGKARVREGGKGAVRVTERGLASLFCGFVSAREGKMQGLVEGEDAALRSADVFLGGVPWMVDMY